MRVQATDLDGNRIEMIDLVREASDRLSARGQHVLAIQLIGSRVALLIPGRGVCDGGRRLAGHGFQFQTWPCG